MKRRSTLVAVVVCVLCLPAVGVTQTARSRLTLSIHTADWYNSSVHAVPITQDEDDGQEALGPANAWEAWTAPDTAAGLRLGRSRAGGNAQSYAVGLRFHLPEEIAQGTSFTYARLVFPCIDAHVATSAELCVTGIAQDTVAPFDKGDATTWPSHLAATSASAAQVWMLAPGEWNAPYSGPAGADSQPKDAVCNPLTRFSPDVSAIVNEILSRPDWGGMPGTADAQTLALVITDINPADEDNFVVFRDFYQPDPDISTEAKCAAAPISTVLELYPTLYSTFVGRELLGRPTDASITVNAVSVVPDLYAYAEYGLAPNDLNRQTQTRYFVQDVGQFENVLELVLGAGPDDPHGPLQPDAQYFYRLRFARADGPPTAFEAGPIHSFRTQRKRNSAYAFGLQTDSHLQSMLVEMRSDELRLYQRTVENAAAEALDFYIDLGDTFQSDFVRSRNPADMNEAIERHTDQRAFFDQICHSAPLFLALGNHEAEEGWFRQCAGCDVLPNRTPERNEAVWALQARKRIYPNPDPTASHLSGFYTGGTTDVIIPLDAGGNANLGPRESYYAWEWGDALFVVLDPFWNTVRKPHTLGEPSGGGNNDRWRWTLGREQYDWLRATLEASDATYKFVFAHHVTGGVLTSGSAYGRGGVEAAAHRPGIPGAEGSFEWGGLNTAGQWEFPYRRMGWYAPVHDVLVENNVAVFFHGHDHCYAMQELDGIVYQECPVPGKPGEDDGHADAGLYRSGVILPNSGHLRVSVTPARVTVDYVRSVLPEDEGGENGFNGDVFFSYDVTDCNANGVPDLHDLRTGVSADCNLNGLPDACDLAAGSSTDFNNSGVPDECEGLGDLNCDGVTDLFDIDSFVLALESAPTFSAYLADYPDCDPLHADLDGDGNVNEFDIPLFVAALTRPH